MIIFYNKTTGKIKGFLEGRIHPKEHLNMWVGDKKEVGRIIVNWKQIEESLDYEPQSTQKELFIKLDKESSKVYEYKVNIKTKKLNKK